MAENKTADKSIADFISEIKIDKSNLEHISKTGKINGSLFLEIQDKMRAFASQELLCAIPDYESLQKENESKQKEIDQLKAKLQEAEKWISVNDLPTDRILPVLIFNGKAKPYCQCVLQATWFLESNKFRIETGATITYNDITHWMPLPEKPFQTKSE